MEDALVPNLNILNTNFNKSLNPCFNGRCTRTQRMLPYEWRRHVLILVLMEDALVQNSKGLLTTNLGVLILVLMEDALVL